MKKMRKQLLINITISFISIMIFFIIVEFIFFVLDKMNIYVEFPSYKNIMTLSNNSILLYELKNNYNGIYEDTQIETNSYGISLSLMIQLLRNVW